MEEQNIVRDAKVVTEGPKFGYLAILLISAFIILLGTVTGYFLSSNKISPQGVKKITQGKDSAIQKGTIFGSDDIKTFRDVTEGILAKGGVDSEGSHHLVRSGGESQTAYLTSSIVDLDQFAGRKIKVWGETNKAQKAGWLMDVGRVEVLE